MKSTISVLMLVGFVVGLFGCAHSHELENPSEVGDSKNGVRMANGSKEVSEGQRLNVLLIACHRLPARKDPSKTPCHNNKVGEAVVQKIIDEDSAIVVPVGELVINKTMTVEKHKE
mgnify:CR=1 FL=1